MDYDGTESSAPFSARVRADVDGDGSFETLSRAYCRSGECRSLTNSNGHSTTFTADAACCVVRCDYADGTFETVSFNPFGFVAETRQQDGTIRFTGTDFQGRVTSVKWTSLPSGVTPVDDLVMVYDGLGRCVRYTQGSSVVSCAFNSCGNQISENQDGKVVTRSFDHRGRTGITYPDGKKFAEQRDEIGLLLSVHAVSGTGGLMPVVTFDYTGHRVLRSTQGNGVVTDYTFRADGESAPPGGPDDSFDACVRCVVSDASSTVLTDTIYRRDPAQRVIRCETGFSGATLPPGRFHSYTLDRLGRVTACVTEVREVAGGPISTTSSVSYTLDIEGRRLSATGGDWPGTYTQSSALPPGDQQIGQYTSWPGGALEWDDNGNIHSLPMGSTGSLHFFHDACGRVRSVQDGSGTNVCVYNYDAMGRVAIRSTFAGGALASSALFVYDGSGCIQEWGDDGTGTGTVDPALTFACAGGLRQCISTRNGTIYYPHGGGNGGASTLARLGPRGEQCDDGNADPGDGCTSLVTTATGAPVERYDCDDAGKPAFPHLRRPAQFDGIVVHRPALDGTGMRLGTGIRLDADVGIGLLAVARRGSIAHKTKPKPVGANGEGKKESSAM